MEGLKKGILVLVFIAAIVLAAGCTSTKSANSQTSAAPAGTGGSAAPGSAAPPAAAAGGTCPAVTAKTSWSGTWTTWAWEDLCHDGREVFYPATADNPDPWNRPGAGVMDMPVTFTQTGCDITGSITVGPNGASGAKPGCPITLTGKVDSTGAASGTWHAYCDLPVYGIPNNGDTEDSGVWNLNMEPGGSTFIGNFGGTDTANYKSANCPTSTSNWAGKRG